MALTRLTLGKLFAFSDAPVAGILDAFDLTNWQAVGSGSSISLSLGRLRIAFTGSTYYARLLSAAVGHTDIWLRARVSVVSGFPTASINARASVQTGTSNVAGINGIPAAFGVNNAAGIYERNAVTNAPLLQSSTVNAVGNAPLSMDLLVTGTNAVYWQSSAGYSQRSLSGLTVTSGDVFLGQIGASGNVIWYNLASGELSNLLTVQGLPAGMTVDVLSATNTVLASGTASAGGIASIDLRTAGVAAGAARSVRVNDGVTAVATPVDGVWGGDVWTVASSGGGPSARTVRRKAGARNLLLKR